MLWKKCVKNKIILLLVVVLSLCAAINSRQNTEEQQKQTSSIRREKEIVVEQSMISEVASVAVAIRDKHTVSGNLSGTVSGNATGSHMTDETAAVLELLNDERKAVGFDELVWNDALAEAAIVRAKEITTSFSHKRPDGSDWWSVNEKLMYGENLAKGYSSASEVMQAWMESEEHKDNILYPGFKQVGIAVYQLDGQWYWVQEFAY